jgi:hypothetical protein
MLIMPLYVNTAHFLWMVSCIKVVSNIIGMISIDIDKNNLPKIKRSHCKIELIKFFEFVG